MARTTSLAVCSLSQSSNGHMNFIHHLENKLKINIQVSYVCISSEHLDSDYDFSLHDGAVLIHSADSGRLSLTDVPDARYEKLLHRLETALGKHRVGILITGVPDAHEELLQNIRTQQPKTKRNAAYVNVCDTALDEHVTQTITMFLSKLSQWEKPPKKPEKDNSSSRKGPIITEKVTIPAEQLKSITVKDNIDLIICAERSTESTLLRTLCEMHRTTDFLVFQQNTGDLPENEWNFVEVSNIATRSKISDLMHCAVFIYRNNVPTEFSSNDFTEIRNVMKERKNRTYVEVKGVPDASCLKQLSMFMRDCMHDNFIATVTQGEQEKTCFLKDNPRLREHQEEATRMEEESKRNANLKQNKHQVASMEKEKLRLTDDIVKLKRERQELSADLKRLTDDNLAQNKIEKEKVEERTQEKRSLQHEIKELQRKCDESSASHQSLVNDNAILKSEIVREKEKRKQVEMNLSENVIKATHTMEMYKQRELELEDKLKSKELHIGTMVENIQKTEETARREVERLQTEKEDERARSGKEKRSLAADMTKKLESKQHHVDTMTETVVEKERNEITLRQTVEELKNERQENEARFEKEKLSIESSWKKELDSKKQHMEQLERETWKLRTKIQLESEVRSAELKKKTETPQWMQSLIPWMNSGKLAQSGKNSSEDISTGQNYPSERSTTLQAEELPNDEFADILKQVADDLSSEANIDSLGSQLGILQGDIARALKTNMRYEQITSRGTHLMLKQWRRGVSREDERIELRRALEAAKLLDTADRYVSQRNTVEDYRQRKEDSRQLSGIDSTPSSQGIPEERTKTHETTSSTDRPHYDDISSQNQGETANEDTNMGQHSKTLSNHNTADDFGTFEDISPEKAAVSSAPSNRERNNLDDGEHDADLAIAGDITPQEINTDFQQPGSAHNNDGNDVIVDVRDGEMEEHGQEPQSALSEDHGSTRALQNSEDPASEKPCCSWCYPFRYSRFR